jgi:hypothetical protein
MNEAVESRLKTISVVRRQSARTFLNQATKMPGFHPVRFQVLGEFASVRRTGLGNDVPDDPLPLGARGQEVPSIKGRSVENV